MGETVGNILSGAAKGAAMGSVVPGIGTVIGGAAGAALAVAPEVGKWLFGETGKQVAEQVAATVEAVTGTSDPEAQRDVLADPEKATELRVKLLAIAGEREAARDAHHLAMFRAAAEDRDAARKAQATLVASGSAMAWATPIISGVVLFSFLGVILLIAIRGVPAGAETILNILVGTLVAMATSVVSYYVGSSQGSASKEKLLASRRGESE